MLAPYKKPISIKIVLSDSVQHCPYHLQPIAYALQQVLFVATRSGQQAQDCPGAETGFYIHEREKISDLDDISSIQDLYMAKSINGVKVPKFIRELVQSFK